ncbi:MAG: hypothetical protein H7A45_11580 [Verrucomicrobiales bacterium]|nr:hypothetical protein [Verrucomicrobiales bacterium]MCP5525994.1 hypothetical protein [Verrucomicrobiales bacterium]
MTIQMLKAEVEALSADERRRLAAFLVALRHKDLAAYRSRMTEKMDDKAPENWLTLEEFDARLES